MFGPCPLSDILTPLPLYFFVVQQLAKRQCPLEPHRDSVLGGVVGLKSYCTVVEIRRDYMCRALGLFLTHKHCDVETGQMSAVETGQMSAVETRRMSSAETRQM